MYSYFVYRSSITGKFVTKEYALQHPDITIRQEIHVTRKAKG